MLFFLSDELIDLDLNGSNDYVVALENILQAAHNGYHLLVADKNVSEWLLENSSCFNKVYTGLIKSLVNNFSENKAILGMVGRKIVVDLSSSLPLESSGFDWCVNLEYFIDRESTDRSALVCEDLTDCDLVVLAGRAYQESKNVHGGLKMAFSNVNGGGSNTVDALINSVERNQNMSLCVVDSDRVYPSAPLGCTASLCREYIDSMEGLAELYIIESREAENIIPTSLLMSADVHPDIDMQEKIDSLSDELKYVDFKVGICKKKWEILLDKKGGSIMILLWLLKRLVVILRVEEGIALMIVNAQVLLATYVNIKYSQH